ncbi:CHASE2 domain-containing protein [Leptothermofonsia sp. ETS-13]|uniref:CHASE2 domain-containing protein n=1 Tax=Leptothermofonsia sp. ETS-13 TaxID=3035696 RepID=UPI003BA0D094
MWLLRLNPASLPKAILVPFAIGATSLTVTGGLVVARQLEWLQPPELAAYDQMMRLRQDAPPDPRLLLVAINEADIKNQNRWPLSDLTVASLLTKLQKYRPKVIGLDIYRDLPQEPGNRELAQQLKAPNVVVITKISDEEDLGVAAPPGVPKERIGFNDIPPDTDSVIRRSLLYADTESTTLTSFSLQLAIAYLQNQGITPQAGQLNPEHLRLGKAEFVPLESSSALYQNMDAAGYQILLDYRARQNLAQQVSLTQVLNNEFDPRWVEGKIVIVGTSARSVKDVFLTPYSAAARDRNWTMPGVVIHAQIVSHILSAALGEQHLFWYWSDWVEVLWIAAWATLGGSLAWFIRHPLGLIGVTLVVLVILGGICFYGFFLQAGWVPVVSPALGLLMAAGLMVAYRAQQAYRQQQMMMKLLGQNTSPEIANALWKSRDRLLKSGKLPGQRLYATMLFTDIKDFSTISEYMPPENLLEWLNEYLSAITQEVITRHGIINKFTGDGMLAVFGVPINRTAPIEVSADARFAVECALAMRDQLQRLNVDWQRRGLPTAQMRVGIFTGPIVAGSLGGKDRLEYGVIGDSVNIAARLESYEKSRQSDVCRILIARETLVHLEDRFEVEPWGPLALKGKQQMVDVYRVLGYATTMPKVMG